MRTHRPSRGSLAFFAVLLLGLTSPGRARADEKQACLAASDKGQQLKLDGKLRAAKEQLMLCARSTCPAIVRQDCAQWTSDIMVALPSVVIGARDWQGHDVLAVKVVVDGAPLTDTLDGKPLPVDPGAHTFHYEATATGAAVEEQVLVREGEKNRPLTVTFPAPPGAAPPASPPNADGHDSPQLQRSSAPSPLMWVFGGLGVAALGTALFFDLSANSDVNALRGPAPGGCSPNCTSSQIDPIRTKYLVSGVSLGVGIVSLGVATVFFFARPSDAAPADAKHASIGVDFGPTSHGGAAQVFGRF